MKKTLVYQKLPQIPAGGPEAVCYYYNQEQIRRQEKLFEFLPNDNTLNNSINKPKILLRFINGIKLAISYLMIERRNFKPQVDVRNYDIIHFHDTPSLFYQIKNLKGYKGKIVLQSHTPVPTALELFDNLPPYLQCLLPFLKKKLRKIDLSAFMRADYIIFPCGFAEETYLNNWDEYKTIRDSNSSKFRYILTGIPPAKVSKDKLSIRRELGIPVSDFVMSYVGRHNHVKGFDLLKVIGKQFLDINQDSWIIVTGNESPIKGLIHQRWTEIGWTNIAMSYVNASDVFILPNRETYFDIVALEVLSLGKILVASRTGGNKYFESENVKGVFLYDTIEEAVELLGKIKAMSIEERFRLGEENRVFFEKKLSVRAMYDNYKEFLSQI